ncbi:GNAT family N-acetyltransferase [Falsibacillus albus]|uniref:N-acetyltransferase n=1 Tax=Falsibacillus albus TaxID=2478915 RepID=A0A3L7JVY8_9BACI|nr:GNAT family N-acetyltransferase [Falsibacillus albus]RLQ94279.1 N-acetyltransferase [Falsibacillus albus]
MKVIETERLILRRFMPDDAPFMLELMNDADYIKNIGDRGIRTKEEAKNSLLNGPMKMYEEHGFGLFLTELKENHTPMGMCGLIKREGLEDVDIGYAFLPGYRGKGYAVEAAKASLEYGKNDQKLKRVVAITSVDNEGSIKLLERIGLQYEKLVTLPNDDEELKLFGINF